MKKNERNKLKARTLPFIYHTSFYYFFREGENNEKEFEQTRNIGIIRNDGDVYGYACIRNTGEGD